MAMPTSTQQNPIDENVDAALRDIARAEEETARLKSARKSRIARIARLLERAHERLESSANHEHTTWHEASERLDTIMTQLAQIRRPDAVTGSDPADLSDRDRAQLATVEQQVDGLIEQVHKVAPVDFTKKLVAERWRDHVRGMKDQYLSISEPRHAEAVPVAQKITALESYIERRISKTCVVKPWLGD